MAEIMLRFLEHGAIHPLVAYAQSHRWAFVTVMIVGIASFVYVASDWIRERRSRKAAGAKISSDGPSS